MFAQTETQAMMVEMADRLLAKENEFEIRRHRLAAMSPDSTEQFLTPVYGRPNTHRKTATVPAGPADG